VRAASIIRTPESDEIAPAVGGASATTGATYAICTSALTSRTGAPRFMVPSFAFWTKTVWMAASAVEASSYVYSTVSSASTTKSTTTEPE